ncbi:hypothetical protein [Roseateles aquatilis]|uniref:hypothetical protein n=1 Tax=Roseateles aquatilis TaxID=431061 RepID=UPI00113036C7|nr:hypothetical protein [Roseateles aquatilis]
MATIVLGNNRYINCGSAVTMYGTELFNLREVGENGQIVVDFDVLDKDGRRLIRVKKNQVVDSADGVSIEVKPGSVKAISADGNKIASARILDENTVAVTGLFWVNGVCCEITEKQMSVAGLSISGSTFRDTPSALVLR